jgi:hypothetical protein
MKAFSFILTVLFILPFQSWARDCNDFGTGVSLYTQKTSRGDSADNFVADYNGDGITDRVVFLRLVSKPEFAPDVKVVYLFGDKPEYPENGSVAIGIILMGKAGYCEKQVIYNDGFFRPGETATGEGDPLPVKLIKKNSDAFLFWKKQEKSPFKKRDEKLRFDALEIGSESGNCLLYWGKTGFTVTWDETHEN